jgi:hypothetical protein
MSQGQFQIKRQRRSTLKVAVSRARFDALSDNPFRLTQIATGPVVPLTGLLSLFDFGVVTEVQPFQTTARTTRLDIGWIAIVARCDVVRDVAKLGAEGTVGGTSHSPFTKKVP